MKSITNLYGWTGPQRLNDNYASLEHWLDKTLTWLIEIGVWVSSHIRCFMWDMITRSSFNGGLTKLP